MWALVDCDNFFCSCERVWRPDLNGKPVVVLSNNDGCVVARSREAKSLGIKMGIPYYQMREQYSEKEVIAFSSNYKLYADMSSRVMATLRLDAPVLHQYSIDEAFIDLNDFESEDVKSWGENLARKVWKWTGIPVSMGIAPSKTLAKIAAKFAKKYAGYHKACAIITDHQREAALKLTEVGDVWGIGRRIARHLNKSGVYTAFDYTMKSRSWIKTRFHVPGERTWLELNGQDVIGVDEMGAKPKQTIVTSRSFPGMIDDFDELKSHVANYASRCSMKLRRQKSVCRAVMTFIESNRFREDLPQYSNAATHFFITPTNDTIDIVSASIEMLKKIFLPGIKYKRGGVMVSEISGGAVIQPDLFEFDINRLRKHKSVSQTIDKVNCSMGNDTLILASQLYSSFDESGKSVKFAHAIKRALLSPDYSTSIRAFRVK